MSWHDDAWAYRVPVIVDDRAGSGSRDVTITVPRDLAEFWSNVQSDGDDVRVFLDDGTTAVTYQLAAGFDVATRTATIQVDNATAPQAAMNVLWLYWGNASATSAAGSFSPSTPRTGTIFPQLPALSAPIFDGLTASARPPAVWIAGAGESRRIWWDVSGILAPLRAPSEGQLAGQEVQALLADAQDGGAGASSLWVAGSERIVITPDGRTLVGYTATGRVDAAKVVDRIKVWLTGGDLFILTAQGNTFAPVEA